MKQTTGELFLAQEKKNDIANQVADEISVWLDSNESFKDEELVEELRAVVKAKLAVIRY